MVTASEWLGVTQWHSDPPDQRDVICDMFYPLIVTLMTTLVSIIGHHYTNIDRRSLLIRVGVIVFTTVLMLMVMVIVMVMLVMMVLDGRLLTLHYSRIISVGSITRLLGGIQLIRLAMT